MRSFFLVLSILGTIVMVFAAILVLPSLASWIAQDGAWRAYPVPIGLALGCGGALWWLNARGDLLSNG